MRRKLKRVSPAGYSGCYYLLTDWRDADEAGFDLLLTDGRQAWKCQVNRDNLHQMACDVDRDLFDYCAETRQALASSPTDDSDDFDFEIKPSGHRVQLTWKKSIAGDDVKFKLGSLLLVACPDSGDVVCRMLDFEVDQTSHLHGTINDLENENDRLKQQAEDVLQRLEKCVNEKDSLEQDLFGKFKILINSKKSRIRQLKQQVDDAREEASQASALAAKHAEAAAAASSASGAGGDEVDGETALMREDSASSSSWGSSASRSLPRKHSVVASTQLLEDEEEDLTTKPPAKRRRRRESGTATRQANIPLPPSMSTQPTSRPGSSLRSRRTMATIDAEAVDAAGGDDGNQLDEILNDM
eukprot:scpid84034/ scgid2832/ DNA repair protein XRCC4; X-ray repair cross-complementing protein 4